MIDNNHCPLIRMAPIVQSPHAREKAMKNFRLSAIVTSICVLSVAALTARGDTIIDMEGMAGATDFGGFTRTNIYTEDGFTIQNNAKPNDLAALVSWNPANPAWTGTRTLLNNYGASGDRLQLTSAGGPFAVSSIDFASEQNTSGFAGVLYGTQSNLTVVTYSFTTPNGPGLSTVALSGFTDLIKLEFDVGTAQIDNIHITDSLAAVPLPNAALAGLALMAVMGLTRKHAWA